MTNHIIKKHGNIILGLAVFIIILIFPAPLGLSLPAWHTAAVGCLMIIWWVTEAIPIPVTALLPLLLLPILGVNNIKDAAVPYANPLIFLFMGGFILALTLERWDLHRRIALHIIVRVGTGPRTLIFGFMLACALLSMWISNTATTLMMLPVGLALIDLYTQNNSAKKPDKNFAPALLLGIAYASSIGGLGTLIGSPPNAFFAAFMASSFGIKIDFVRWMMVGVPLVIVSLPLAFIILTKLIFPVAKTSPIEDQHVIANELKALGKMSRPEKSVAVIFVFIASLWICRPLLTAVIPGLSDAGIAILAAVLVFIVPTNLQHGEFLLDWEWARRLPWGVLLLFGGGLSLANAIYTSGLATWMGDLIGVISNWPQAVIIFISILLMIVLTEVISNIAATAVLLPIIAIIANKVGASTIDISIAVTLTASCAFMLPIATPPNAIVFGSRKITILQMVKAGVWLNILFIFLIFVVSSTVVPAVFSTLKIHMLL